MSYRVQMDAENVECRIPLADLGVIAESFWGIIIRDKHVQLTFEWEEDETPLAGKVVGKEIVLNKKQNGSFLNSSDGGLAMLLEKYNGSGTIREDGEEGDDVTITRYENGSRKKGKIVFEE